MTSVSFPGVYVEEVPSGAFTITGVSTAVTAFVGRAVLGPVSKPVHCFSYGDYELHFGGRRADLPMSYAVEDFFLNGGGEAVVVRLTAAPATAAADAPATDDAADSAGADAAGTDAKAADAKKGADLKKAPDPKDAANAKKAAGDDAAPQDPAQNAAQDGAKDSGKAPDATAATPVTAATAKLTLDLGQGLGTVALAAVTEGVWGNDLKAQVDRANLPAAILKTRNGTKENSFNLTLEYRSANGNLIREYYPALNTADAANGVVAALVNSNLAIATGAVQKVQAKADTDGPSDVKPDAKADAKPDAKADAKSDPEPVQPVVKAPAAPASDTPLLSAFTGGADGPVLTDDDILGNEHAATGLYALNNVDLINILCIPEDQIGVDISTSVHAVAADYCADRRAIYVVDAPSGWKTAVTGGNYDTINPGEDLGITDQRGQQCTAVYFPRIRKPDVENAGLVRSFPVCGVIAGQMARTDATRGVWKAPAGVANGMAGVTDLEVNLTDAQQGKLNPIGINCLRNFRVLGPLVWGARTLRGIDMVSDDYKYVPVRRLAHYIEESLARGLKSTVFEPNDETLWSQIRLTVRSFMGQLSQQGAFYGFDVACDGKINTQDVIDQGICLVEVAFAPVKPAEFIVLRLRQSAGPASA